MVSLRYVLTTDMVSLSLPAAASPFAAVIGGTSIQETLPCSCSCRFVGAGAFYIYTTPGARARALSAPPKRFNAQPSQDYPVQEIRIPNHWFLPSNALQVLSLSLRGAVCLLLFPFLWKPKSMFLSID